MRRSLVAVVAVAALASGCGTEKTVSNGSGSDTGAAAAPPPAASTPAATTPAPATSGSASSAKISTDLAKKPVIPKPAGAPPTQLVSRDIVKGKGRTLKAGDQATVRYVGIAYSTGRQFDASWDRGQDFPFAVGQGQVIPGWDQGLQGMRVGGRRELTIPPELAYGAQGQPPTIQPNETLVFVVDLKRIG